jgi:hypothetical protein
MLDVTFLPLLFTMTAPQTWLPTDYFPSVTPAAWSSTAISGVYNPSDIGLIEPGKVDGILQISGGDTPSITLQIDNDVQTALRQMYLQHDLVSQLESFSELPADWAGDETQVPSRSTIASAKTLLSSLSSDHALPQVSPSADGEIGFTWLRSDLRIEALLYPDNHLVWLWTSHGNVNPGGEGKFNGSFPDNLLDMIATASV